MKDELIELVLLAVILNSSLDLLLRETFQYLIVILRQSEFGHKLLVFALFLLIAVQDFHSLIFVNEEGLLAMKADEGDADITGGLFHHFDFVVHFGILVIDIPGLGYHLELFLNALDAHPIDDVLATRSFLHLDVLLDDD